MRMLIALLLLATSLLSIGSLVSGAAYAESVLPGGLPIGNVMAAFALCSLAGAALFLSAPGSSRHRASSLALRMAVLWLPLSLALAGNLALNFSGLSGTTWIALSSLTFFAVLGSLLWAVSGLVLAVWGKSSAT